MPNIRTIASRLAKLTLKQRIIHCLLFLGIPLLVWDLAELFTKVGSDVFLGSSAVILGILIQVFGVAVTAVVAALVEHAIFTRLGAQSVKPGPSI